MGRGSGVNGIGDVLMNKSTLEKQTGLRAFKANCNYYLGDYGLGDGFIYQGYSDSRAWQNLSESSGERNWKSLLVIARHLTKRHGKAGQRR